MRVTDQMILGTVLNNLLSNEQALQQAEYHVTTGKALSQASDDPFAASQIVDFHQRIGLNTQLQANLTSAKGWLDSTDSALDSLQNDVQRARQLAIQGSNDTLTPTDRQNVALEIHQLLLSAVDTANSKFGDEFIFGGTQTTEQPFIQDGSSQSPNLSAGALSPVRYMGDTGTVTRQTDQAAQLGINVSGNQLQGLFNTLAQLEYDLNNSTVRVSGNKVGIDPQTDKTSGFPGTVETFSINGIAIGTPVNVTLSGVQHQVIGFAPQTPIKTVVDQINAQQGQTGVTASINSDGVLVLQTVPGSNVTHIRVSDVDAVVKDVAGNDLTNNTGVPVPTGGDTASDLGLSDGPDYAIGASDVAALDSQLQNLNTLRAQIGAKTNRVEDGTTRLSSLAITLQSLNSNYEDADMTKAVSDLATQQTTFQAALEAAAKVLPPTLMNFLS